MRSPGIKASPSDAIEEFPLNVVRNQKHSIVSFVPAVLYEQVRSLERAHAM